MTHKRYRSVDCLKGICILFIVITHYAWNPDERLRYFFPFWIGMAVPIFMIISGFVYTKSFYRHNIDSFDAAYSIDFLMVRICRYTVPFFIAFIVEQLVCYISGDFEFGCKRLLFLFLCGGGGPGSYYFPIIIQLLFFFPIVFYIVRKFGLGGVILCGVINIVYEILKSAYGMNVECYRLLIFRYTLLISYGCYLAMDNYKRHRLLALVCLFVGAVYIILVMYLEVVPPITDYWTPTSIWAALYIIPMASPILLSNIHYRPLEMLGKASWEIFLVQMVYYNGINYEVYKYVDNRCIQLFISVITCVLMGLLFYLIDKSITPSICKCFERVARRFESVYIKDNRG